ncbi:MAG: MCE family protein [Gammaproteobacteria bacterium]|nr:MCE family protein [Gammaproteobacteria bacterium]
MNQEKDNALPLHTLPEVVPQIQVQRCPRISLVWLVPLIAAFIGAWLAYKSISEKGPVIRITFREGTGLEAGKTKIKYKSVNVGEVKNIRIGNGSSRVSITASLNTDIKNKLNQGTKFWVERPRISLGGVSGLGTLVSGAYIEMEPGPGAPAREFTGLEQPPIVRADLPGRRFVLETDRLGSLAENVPVYFREIRVGKVLGHELAEDNRRILVHIFINVPYHGLVRENSRFWHASGIDMSLSTNGVRVKTESLISMLFGGVAFESPGVKGKQARVSEEGAIFKLHESYDSVNRPIYTEKVKYVAYFKGSVRGLRVGAPVEFRGIRVGSVADIRIEFDTEQLDIRIPVILELEPERVIPVGGWVEPEEALETLIGRGLKARLQTGNLLSGELYVDMAIHATDCAPRQIVQAGEYPEFPTAPSELDELKQAATGLLADLRKLPLDQIAREVLETMQGFNRLANSPELQDSARSLNKAIKHLDRLIKNTDKHFVPLAASIEKTMTAARAVLEVAEPGSRVAVDLANTLEEASEAARSIRVLANYLERNPDALLYGK